MINEGALSGRMHYAHVGIGTKQCLFSFPIKPKIPLTDVEVGLNQMRNWRVWLAVMVVCGIWHNDRADGP